MSGFGWGQCLETVFPCVHGFRDSVGSEDTPTLLRRTERCRSVLPVAGVKATVSLTWVPLCPPASALLSLTFVPFSCRHMLVDRLSKGEEVGTASTCQGSECLGSLTHKRDGMADCLHPHVRGNCFPTVCWD